MKWVEWSSVLTYAVTCLSLLDRMKEEKTPKFRIYTLLFFFWLHLYYTWKVAAGDLLPWQALCLSRGTGNWERGQKGRAIAFSTFLWSCWLEVRKKNLLAWSYSLQLLYIGKWRGKNKIRREKKQLFLGLPPLMIFFDRMAFLTEAKSIPWPLNRRKESPRYQRYCEIFSWRTASMAGALLSCRFTWPKPFTSLFIISVCAQRHTRPSRQNLEGCLHGVWNQEVCPGGVIQQHGSQLKLGVTNSGSSWGRRFPSAHTHMECSQAVVLSVRFWC